MKKLTIPLSLLLFSAVTPTFASHIWDPLQPFFPDTFIVGASVAYAERLGDLDTTMIYTHPDSFFVPTSFIRDKFVNTGEQVGVLVGYQMDHHCCAFGLEFSIDWDRVAEHYLYAFADTLGQEGIPPGIAFDADSYYERGMTMALTGRWGYRVNKYFMPYLRFGLETSRDYLAIAFRGNPGIYNFSTIIEGSHRQYRYLVGAGGEMSLCFFPMLAMRIEYNFHSKGERVYATGAIYDNDPILGRNPIFEAVAMPKMHAVKFSLVWNIDV